MEELAEFTDIFDFYESEERRRDAGMLAKKNFTDFHRNPLTLRELPEIKTMADAIRRHSHQPKMRSVAVRSAVSRTAASAWMSGMETLRSDLSASSWREIVSE